MENTSEKIKNNLGSVVKVMNYAIKKEKSSLIELLRKNGAEIKSEIDNSALRKILISALRESETFRIEFRNWVIEKSGLNRNERAKKELANLSKLPKKFTNANGFVNPGFDFDENFFSQNSTTSTNQTSNSTPTNDGGFWNVDLNTLLDFAKDGINNYAIIVKSKSDEAVMSNAVALEQEKENSFNPTDTSNSKTKYIVLGIVAIAVIGLSIWYFNKPKK